MIHDPAADRWILTNLAYSGGATSGPFDQCIAVSQTSDPVTGGWYLYDLRMDQGAVPVNTLNDYPKFGIWTDCLYFAFNGFLNGASYNGSGFGSLSKSDMYAGQAVTGAVGFLAGSGSDAFTMIPSNLEDTNGLAAERPAGLLRQRVAVAIRVQGPRVHGGRELRRRRDAQRGDQRLAGDLHQPGERAPAEHVHPARLARRPDDAEGAVPQGR